MGYFFGGSKPVDSCKRLYHQGAQTPSIAFGPASHLHVFELKLITSQRIVEYVIK